MIRLILATASFAALSTTIAHANGLDHAGGYVSYSSRNGGDDQGIRTYGNVETSFNRFTIDSEFTRDGELKSDGKTSNFDEGSVTLRFGYQVTDALAVNVGVHRDADTTDASTFGLLGMEYNGRNAMADLSLASGNDSRTVLISAVGEFDNGITVGGQFARTWDDNDDEDFSLATIAARYSAPQYEVTGTAVRLPESGESAVMLAGAYNVTSSFAVLAGAGALFDPESTDSRHYSVGARYRATPLMSVDAIYAGSVDDNDKTSRGFGLALTWELGKRDNARSVMTGLQRDTANIVQGYR